MPDTYHEPLYLARAAACAPPSRSRCDRRKQKLVPAYPGAPGLRRRPRAHYPQRANPHHPSHNRCTSSSSLTQQ
eukprot:263821-Chlamydomonas_euryale.AAC.2